mmetsp:Transcript_25386/g.63448  ORF Transcript_25386/g.63448 Transcript_25386/m.63448 type:complete len:80 (+) Transcript_25386:264-503(+)
MPIFGLDVCFVRCVLQNVNEKRGSGGVYFNVSGDGSIIYTGSARTMLMALRVLKEPVGGWAPRPAAALRFAQDEHLALT